jgi:GntR family transcriptional regulator/MocR family aminotransferase
MVMKGLLIEKLGERCRIVSEGAGLAILIAPTDANFSWETLKKLAHKNRIAIYLAKERSGGNFEAVRMGFGGFKESELKEAIEAFSSIWHQSTQINSL